MLATSHTTAGHALYASSVRRANRKPRPVIGQHETHQHPSMEESCPLVIEQRSPRHIGHSENLAIGQVAYLSKAPRATPTSLPGSADRISTWAISHRFVYAIRMSQEWSNELDWGIICRERSENQATV